MDSTSLPYPFANKHFDVVYAHLGLHYFSTDVTRGVFTEIARILDYGGRFFGLFNSIKDPEAGTGKLIEPNFYELSPGDCKRFFSVTELPSLFPAEMRIDRAECGQGTRNNPDDPYVLAVATKQN